MANQIISIEEVKAAHPNAHIQSFDAGEYYDTIVWACEEDSVNDDGANAIARYRTDEAV